MDFVEAGYASVRMGCLTARGASGFNSCFLRWELCVTDSSSFVRRLGGSFPVSWVSIVSAILTPQYELVCLRLDCSMPHQIESSLVGNR